jgi:hypothetical protein
MIALEGLRPLRIAVTRKAFLLRISIEILLALVAFPSSKSVFAGALTSEQVAGRVS